MKKIIYNSQFIILLMLLPLYLFTISPLFAQKQKSVKVSAVGEWDISGDVSRYNGHFSG